MQIEEWCEVSACHQQAVGECAHCHRALCADHTVIDYRHLPGGQRPYCLECDRERRSLYLEARRQGLRATAWSGVGAIVGAIVGYGVSVLLTPDSFTHSVTTDFGFISGLAIALSAALATNRTAQSSQSGQGSDSLSPGE